MTRPRLLSPRRGLLSALAAAMLLPATSCLDVDMTADVPSPAQVYVTYILNQMQQQSVRRASVDWTATRADVMARVPREMSIEEAYPAIERALTILSDGTSTFRTRDGEVLTGPLPACTAPAITAVPIPANVGYLHVDSITNTRDSAVAYANALQDLIRRKDRADLAGWVIDLRGTGGQTLGLDGMWAMLAGLGPLLGADTVGYAVPLGTPRQAWRYMDGEVRLADSTKLTVASPYTLLNPAARVAVLTDGGTARSGEAIAVSFRARPLTRSFGSQTCGLPLFKTLFPMVDHGRLDLATAMMGDRGQSAYNSRIPPQEIINDPTQALQRAIAWVQEN